MELTLVGQDSTNPALPRRNVRGTLTIEHCNLTFYGEGFTHKIPLEHLDSMQPYHQMEAWGQEWRFLLGLLMSGVFILGTAGIGFVIYIWFFWWHYSPTEVQVVVKAWDEEHGLTAITVFGLGKKRRYRSDVTEIIQQIWAIRGECRQTERRQGQVVYRE